MTKLYFNNEDISTYRSELMGWAILWIMMLHFTFIQIKPLGFVAQYGFAGVDVFMFVSGLGLFYSLNKDCRVLNFYKRRLLRIFPTYYIIGFFINLVVTHDSFGTYLLRYSTIGFWTGGIYADWFIPSIIALYLIAPLFYYIIEKKWFWLIILIATTILLISYFLADKTILDRSHFFLLYRIPAFIFGMICAYWIKNDKPTHYFFFILLVGLPFFIYFFPLQHQFYNFKYFSLAFLLPFFVLCFVIISKYLTIISTLISKMGQSSLEIYLIQSIFFSLVISGKTASFENYHDILTILMIIISTLLGIVSHCLIEKFVTQRLQ